MVSIEIKEEIASAVQIIADSEFRTLDGQISFYLSKILSKENKLVAGAEVDTFEYAPPEEVVFDGGREELPKSLRLMAEIPLIPSPDRQQFEENERIKKRNDGIRKHNERVKKELATIKDEKKWY